MADYLRPTSLDEALGALAERPWTMLAGGTDVYPANVGRPIVVDVLDVTGLHGLRSIAVDGEVVRVSALATWTDLVRTDLPPAFDGLKAAARSIGGVQIQNRGTLAGNVCNASPAADGLPNLMALDARVELSSTGGVREVPVGEFVVGNRRTIRRPDELLTAIVMPQPTASARSTFLKLGSRAYLVISIASVAAVMDVRDGRVASARIIVGACSEVPMRIEASEARLLGQSASPSLAGSIHAVDLDVLSPIDDVRGPATYRREVALTLVRRAVAELLS
jgi:CO/xanthine dehydrogenase FAD-binding subunit